jgi:hypothetical protein
MKKQTHIFYGLITSAILIILICILYSTKLGLNDNVQMGLVCGLIISGVYASCAAFKKLESTLGVKEVFFNGFRTTAIIALIMIAFGSLVITIFPSIKNTQVNNFRTFNITNIKEEKVTTINKINGTSSFNQIAKDSLILNATQLETTNLNNIEKEVESYKSKFLTMFIGLNMMVIVISGLIGSAIANFYLKRK